MPKHTQTIIRAFNLLKEGIYKIEADQVWSNKRNRYLKPTLRGNGYKAVILTDKEGEFNISLHQLVALNKFGLYTKLIVNHRDGNKLNNDPENIELVTYKQNSKHAIEIGLKRENGGSTWWKSKLSKDDLNKIVQMQREGVSQYQIAKNFNINQSNISRVLSGKRYKKEMEDIRQ